MISTLFGHLATRFATHPENLATEALGYVLRGSSVAREAISDLLSHAGMAMTGELAYQNQVAGEDEGQPDLVGLDVDGQQRLVMEAKFWAGLTDHQPNTYLGRLPSDGGVLLFVAPAARETLLWGELIRRCVDAGHSGALAETSAHMVRRYALADGRYMALVSWRTLLGMIHGRVEAGGDRKSQGDIEQLMGLCEHMDSSAFLPLTSEEITSPLYNRVLQFGDLADDAVSILVDRGMADTKGLNRQPFRGIYGRYFRFHGTGAYLACDLIRWNTLAPTPIWLTFGQSFAPCSPELREALAPLAAMVPARLFPADKGALTIPLYLPTGRTRDEVMVELLDQLDAIGARLPKQVAQIQAGEPSASGGAGKGIV